MNPVLVSIKLVTGVQKKVLIETLSRIGIADKKSKILYPSCYYYEIGGRSYVCHFKELFAIQEGGFNNISLADIERRNSIIFCLINWGLIEVESPDQIEKHGNFVFILPFSEKKDWVIKHKIKIEYKNG